MHHLEDSIHRAIDYAAEKGTFDLRNIVDSSENVVLFGLGRYFEEAFERQKVKERFHVRWLCDNNPSKWGQTFHGLSCISPADLSQMVRRGQEPVVIIMLGDGRDAYAQLSQVVGPDKVLFYDNLALVEHLDEPRDVETFMASRGSVIEAFRLIEEERSREVFASVFNLRVAPALAKRSYTDLLALSAGPEYFDPSVYQLGPEETFVDCGAFTGDTIDSFINLTEGKFKHIYAFELSAVNVGLLRKRVAALDPALAARIECIEAGVADHGGSIEYSEDSSADGFSIFSKSDLYMKRGQLTRLDDWWVGGGVRPSLLKMDIEGAEMAALAGARRILTDFRPKAAICVYHRTSDMWKVPLFLRETRSDYSFFFRQHCDCGHVGTCCYAI